MLASGEIVARASGPMEFGARALGNRSILADPINQDVVRIINRMIKNRDFWMPFAPVVMRRESSQYFANPKSLPSPYMMNTFSSTDKRDEFMAAVHNADLTAPTAAFGAGAERCIRRNTASFWQDDRPPRLVEYLLQSAWLSGRVQGGRCRPRDAQLGAQQSCPGPLPCYEKKKRRNQVERYRVFLYGFSCPLQVRKFAPFHTGGLSFSGVPFGEFAGSFPARVLGISNPVRASLPVILWQIFRYETYAL